MHPGPPVVILDRRVTDAVCHQHFRRIALRRLPSLVRMNEHPAIAVVVNIDETGRHDAPPAIDRLPRLALWQSTDGDDFIPPYGYIRVEARSAGSINNRST